MSKTAWHLSVLQEHIRTLPREARKSPLEIVESMGRSISIFLYHLYKARDATKGIFNEAEPTSFENFILVLDGTGEKSDELSHAYVVSEAHIIACIHTVRGALDIFSHLINELLLEPRLEIKRCVIYKAHQALTQCELKDRIGTLIQSYWFRYVVAFINTTKHRRLVRHSTMVNFEENRVGIRIGAFDYDGVSYPAYWGRDVLEGILSVKNDLIGCGRSLNTLVAS